MKLKIITVGGTIDKVYFDNKSLYQVGSPSVMHILEEGNATIKYKVQSLLHKDSLEMTKTDRTLIAETILKDDFKHFLVTHGTDTMVKSARKVKKLLHEHEDNEKVVVFTGSMSPAKMRHSDATFNVGCAVTAAQTLPPGVYVIINGKVHDPDNTIKNVEKGVFEKIKEFNTQL
ncbi:MAG TPA: asparaginase domain-containing protein [Victivallales bacterium]|nr:asparaginase domain-containing protein [Victivallales bacterium]